MPGLGEKISVVRTGDELFDVWQDVGQPLPRTEELRNLWRQEIEARRITYLAAKVGDTAVGSVFIKWSGPVNREGEFTKALNKRFPHKSPIPTIYSLHVNPDARGHGLGNKLTAAAEQSIKRRKNVTPIAALNVETDNIYALPIYINRGFRVVRYKGQNAVILDRPTKSGKSKSKKPVYLMAKDLAS